MFKERVAPIIIALSLAGCASTTPNITAAPTQNLSVCPNIGTNLPRYDNALRISNFTATIRLGGQDLLRAPVESCLSSGFGKRRGGAGRRHKGIDLYTGSPRPVFAAGDGTIIFSGRQSGFGNVLIIDHGRDVTSIYAHLSRFQPGIRPGARIGKMEVIGQTGRSGNATAVHLHYEIRVDDRPINPLDFSR